MSKTYEVSKPLKKEKGKEWYQIIIVLIASFEGFTSGALSSWSSPFMVKISQDKVNYNITEAEASLFAVLNNIGLILLTPFLVPVINKIGRKKGILLTSVPYLTSWLTKAFASGIWGFYFARLVVGVGDAIIMCCYPMYIGEVASPRVRGLWGNGFFICVIFGSFIINVVGIYCSVVITSYIFTTLQVIFLILTLFIPESPYYYIAKGKDDDAKKILRQLRRKIDIDEDFLLLKKDVKRQLSESSYWLDLFRIRVNVVALSIAIFLRLAQLLSGVFIFGSYTQYIFHKVGSDISADLSTIIYTSLNFVIYSAAVFGSHKLGRRKSLILSLSGCCFVLLAEGFYFFIDKYYCNEIDIHWFPLVGLILFLVFSSFGIGPLPALMEAELFSASIKSKGISCVVTSFGIISFGVNNVFYYLNNYTGLYGPFLMFGLSSFISLVVTYFVLPETKGKSLEEIQQILKKM